MTTITLFFDGLCQPRNPGGAATYGWQLLAEDTTVLKEGRGLEIQGLGATNNVAEWAGLEAGLWAVSAFCRERLLIRGDSRLVINQLTGRWRVHAAHLRPYLDRCRALLTDMGCEWKAQWIPRDQNEAADALSRLAYVMAMGGENARTLPQNQSLEQ